MKKLFILSIALGLSACNAAVSTDTVSCSYDLAKNEKTCDISKSERHELEVSGIDLTEATKIHTSDGKTYVAQADGSYVEEKK